MGNLWENHPYLDVVIDATLAKSQLEVESLMMKQDTARCLKAFEEIFRKIRISK